MLIFNSTVITSSTTDRTRIISLSHDDLITVTGPLMQCIPLLEKGTTIEDMAKELKTNEVSAITKFVELLASLSLFKENAQFISGEKDGQKFDFADLGSVSVETIVVQDTIYALKAIKEKEF